MTDLSALKEKIKTEAKGLGFNHIGIAPAEPVPHYEGYLAWIREGNQGDMAYLARQDAVAKRGDPRLILEGCLHVISLAMPYTPPSAGANTAFTGKGRISAYALTKDYHNVIWEKLGDLEDFIHNNADIPVALRSYVDTGPVLERSFATRSGIGATGKNSCLIIQGAGSYFFLAEILTDLPLGTDIPYTCDLCGSCKRCIEACPTGCIMPDHTIDARRCISYLTIEHKGVIPDLQKSRMGNWLFGCDICQIVCPHNAWTPEQESPLGEPCLPEFLELTSLFSLNEDPFNDQFGDTPVSRTKREGLLRNAAIVLGNQGNPDTLPALHEALNQETDRGILDACEWAIREIQKQQKKHFNERKTNDHR